MIWLITYSGLDDSKKRGIYKTDIERPTKQEAIEWFENYYPQAFLKTIEPATSDMNKTNAELIICELERSVNKMRKLYSDGEINLSMLRCDYIIEHTAILKRELDKEFKSTRTAFFRKKMP